MDYPKGDDALPALFDKGTHDAIATDDVKLTRRLRALEIPFILPALIILELKNEKRITLTTPLWALDQLRAFISEDEFSMTKLLLEKGK